MSFKVQPERASHDRRLHMTHVNFSRTAQKTPVEQLTNVGKTVTRSLHAVGIITKADLEAATPVSVYLHLCDNFPSKTEPTCNYLYSLEGALTEIHWDELPDARKQSPAQEVNWRSANLTLAGL